jgi:hypothetical protein
LSKRLREEEEGSRPIDSPGSDEGGVQGLDSICCHDDLNITYTRSVIGGRREGGEVGGTSFIEPIELVEKL